VALLWGAPAPQYLSPQRGKVFKQRRLLKQPFPVLPYDLSTVAVSADLEEVSPFGGTSYVNIVLRLFTVDY